MNIRHYLWLLVILFETGFAFSEGESIYLKGIDTQGQAIAATLNDLNSGAALGCVNCHRESGFGGSESGRTFPPVSWYFLSENQPKDNSSRFYPIQNKRSAYTADSFYRLLTSGINSDGRAVDSLMPKYHLTKAQSDELIEYLKTMFSGSDPGVDGENIRIATIVDGRLPQAMRDQHVEFLRGLVAMKNGLTRGELRRKQNSPVQKIPQYESFRKWELVVWELPQDTHQWREILTQNNQQSPVFSVIRPIVFDDYQIVADFCSDQKIPCFFPSGKNLPTGDFYNFVLRNRAKQYQDFISRKKRESTGGLIFIDGSGQILSLGESISDIPETESLSIDDLQHQYAQYCSEENELLIKTDVRHAALVDKLTCPEKARTQIIVMSTDATDYQIIRNYIADNKESRLCWVSDYDQVLKRNIRQARVNSMYRRFGITGANDEEMATTLLAFGLVSESLHQMAGYFSRLYMMELIEHMLNSFPNYSFSSTISGAPYQRYIVGPINEFCLAG